MSYILTYEDAKEICEKYNNTNFWEYQYMIGKYKVCSFNYFICGWDDFNNPLKEKPNVKAFDMRGTTFVFNEDGTLYDTFYMLPKFFNINQVESTQYGEIKDKKIDSVTVKEDGSLVAFMMLPNEMLFAKTIGSFVSEQAENAYKLLHSSIVHTAWVKALLLSGYTPLFEYVSWDNRIVLRYSNAHLRFLGARDIVTGEFIPAPRFVHIPPEGLTSVEEVNATLDELLERANTEENCEGWVVQFEDGQMIKVKTQWYFKLHGLRTQDIFREDYVIHTYLNESLDDVMSQLDPTEDVDAFAFVKKVCNSLNVYMNEIDKSTDNLKLLYINKYDCDWVKFATDNHKEPFFGLSRIKIERPEEYIKRKVDFILHRTSRLKGAKEIIERYKNR